MRDPISALPPEIASRCIFEALPLNRLLYRRDEERHGYPSALLQYTTVSRYWEDLILSTPILWAEIHVHIAAQDLLATLEAFLSLSKDMDFEMVIWSHPGAEWNHVRALLLPHVPRIRVLTVLIPHKSLIDEAEHLRHQLSAASVVINDLDLFSSLKELNFEDDLEMDPALIGQLTLPSHIKVTKRIYSALKEEELDHHCLEYFTNIGTTSHLDDIVPALGSLTNLSTLYIQRLNESVQSNNPTRVLSTAPPHLKTIGTAHPYCPNLRQLIVLTSSRLSCLDIKITVSEMPEIIGILPLLSELQHLSLAFTEVGEISDGPRAIPQIVISCMQYLSLSVDGSLEYDPALFHGLFTVLSTLYPCVRAITLSMDISYQVESYLQSLQHLKTLSFDDCHMPSTTEYRELFLPALLELDVLKIGDLKPYSNPIKAPNLIKLRITGVNSDEHLQQVPSCKLQSLEIYTSYQEQTALTLPSATITEVKRLVVVFHDRSDRWSFTSLHFLVSICLGAEDPMNFQGNMLCAQLIYHPEMCPSLREIKFYKYVEWDLLFIMLEQRNSSRNDVARIERVSVPFVPFIFRQSLLELLLGRQRRNDLTNMVLSLEETRELICDPSIPGCLSCVKNMRPDCAETVRNKPTGENEEYNDEEENTGEGDIEEDDIGVDDSEEENAMNNDTEGGDIKVDNNEEECPLSPFDLEPDARLGTFPSVDEWMAQRRQLVRQWKASYTKFDMRDRKSVV